MADAVVAFSKDAGGRDLDPVVGFNARNSRLDV
jgi:hypothetical protein